MITLTKSEMGFRKNLFHKCKTKGAPKTTRKGLELIVIQRGENVANIYEDGNVQFSGFKSLNEIINILDSIKNF